MATVPSTTSLDTAWPDAFHPAVRTWFLRRFGAPTDAQAAGWPHVAAHEDTLLAAPTGSGKTLAAFLVGIDALIREAEAGTDTPGTSIVYVSPLKALSSDIQRNLQQPLEEIRGVAEELGIKLPPITVGLRTGDTPPAERKALVRNPPHILVSTPESLYLLVTAERSRATLTSVRTVIVDEIHALARDRRGSHLALTLARLDHVVTGAGMPRPSRIGLSATQRPMDEIARFLVGANVGTSEGNRPCRVVDLGHQRDLDLHIEVPPSDLEAVPAKEQWADIYARLAELVTTHRTTLIFVNTRTHSERIAHELAERLGGDAVASHHGSLSRERRQRVEERLKSGNLRALVATASLELGIDIGAIDLVCQVGSPKSIATFLQRIGRSGHALGLRPHGRLFPTTRDELIECAALVRGVRAGHLDRIVQPVAPLDVLAQQVVAEVACEEWGEDALYDLVRAAAPYAALTREAFDDVVEMMATGVGDGAGRSTALLHRDRIHGVLRPRRAARLTAITSGGTIPELGDYRVVTEPEGTFVGTLNEDFAMESRGGDIFMLGTTSWRIVRVEPNTVRVTDAHGAPPTIPFWLGEAPSRTRELSEEVGRLRRDVAAGLDDESALRDRLVEECALPDIGAQQMIDYVRTTRDGLGVVPSDTDVVFERFFDDSGGMQLVVHAPFGMRVNRAWGLALRKRFCVAFDFELQAAANDDAILLSTGMAHSWPLQEAYDWVTPRNAEESVRQSVFYVPLFPTRWRWNITRALALPRWRGGKRVPPFIQRMRADDLMAAVFPEQIGCQENLDGPLTLPDHPLMQQTMEDCLREAMDVDGLVEVLGRVASGAIRYHARDTVEPSPMAHEIVTGKPFTYLDDAPIEERRTRAVSLRRTLPIDARDLAALDPEAIARIADEAWPEARNQEEVHDALLGFVAITEPSVREWREALHALTAERRATHVTLDDPPGTRLWFAVEHLQAVRMLYPRLALPPLDIPPEAVLPVAHREAARILLLRGHAEALGVTSATDLVARTGLDLSDVERGLTMTEAQGFVLRGRYTPGVQHDEWCDRRLLARIHRYTLDRLRREIDPVSRQDYMRFLMRWQRLSPAHRAQGRGGLREVLSRLGGFEAPASAWESDLLRGRMDGYHASWLDELCLSGEAAWARLTPRRPAPVEEGGVGTRIGAGAAATRTTPVTVALRTDLPALLTATRAYVPASGTPETGAAGEVLELLEQRAALFFDEIVTGTRRLATDVEQGLRELIGGGWIASDGFQGLREIAGGRRGGRATPRRSGMYARGGFFAGGGPPGRWSILRAPEIERGTEEELAEAIAGTLLRRYGVLFRDLVTRESVAIPWRLIARGLRRFEARGVVRGGRFVQGVAGEQYALPDAVEALRETRRQPLDGERIVVSAVDPVNLTGLFLPGARIPAQRGRTIEFVDGLPAEVFPAARRLRAATGAT